MAESGSRRRAFSLAALAVFLILLTFGTTVSFAQPTPVAPRWSAVFQNPRTGETVESNAVPIGEEGMLVCVVTAGADPATFRLSRGAVGVSAKLVGYDRVSGLCFLRPDEGVGNPPVWLEKIPEHSGDGFSVLGSSGRAQISLGGWVKQIGGKVFPLAVLRFEFAATQPLPGTAVVDADHRVVGVVFQSDEATQSGYALPVEAVFRVYRDVAVGGEVRRGWLGVSLQAESRVPKIVRVLAGSPAAAADLRPGDVIVSVGGLPVLDYSDVANAFFYLRPGQPVRVMLMRNNDPLDITLTPTDEKPQ